MRAFQVRSDGGAVPETDVRDDEALATDEPYSVVLYNDNVNAMEYVIQCLISVFGHPYPLAAKIMMEAHHSGRALAATEGRTEAVAHCRQLKAKGLNATVEKAS
jgi:ATP-dependent Clp protease adaptor protein ClpS